MIHLSEDILMSELIAIETIKFNHVLLEVNHLMSIYVEYNYENLQATIVSSV